MVIFSAEELSTNMENLFSVESVFLEDVNVKPLLPLSSKLDI